MRADGDTLSSRSPSTAILSNALHWAVVGDCSCRDQPTVRATEAARPLTRGLETVGSRPRRSLLARARRRQPLGSMCGRIWSAIVSGAAPELKLMIQAASSGSAAGQRVAVELEEGEHCDQRGALVAVDERLCLGDPVS